jgi:hypothetical protein
MNLTSRDEQHRNARTSVGQSEPSGRSGTPRATDAELE